MSGDVAALFVCEHPQVPYDGRLLLSGKLSFERGNGFLQSLAQNPAIAIGQCVEVLDCSRIGFDIQLQASPSCDGAKDAQAWLVPLA